MIIAEVLGRNRVRKLRRTVARNTSQKFYTEWRAGAPLNFGRREFVLTREAGRILYLTDDGHASYLVELSAPLDRMALIAVKAAIRDQCA